MSPAKRIPGGRRKSRSAPSNTAEKSLAFVERAAVGLFHWATTDHSGFSQALRDMPPMGFIDSLKYVFCHVLLLLVSAAVLWISMIVLIGYVLPFVLVGVLIW